MDDNNQPNTPQSETQASQTDLSVPQVQPMQPNSPSPASDTYQTAAQPATPAPHKSNKKIIIITIIAVIVFLCLAGLGILFIKDTQFAGPVTTYADGEKAAATISGTMMNIAIAGKNKYSSYDSTSFYEKECKQLRSALTTITTEESRLKDSQLLKSDQKATQIMATINRSMPKYEASLAALIESCEKIGSIVISYQLLTKEYDDATSAKISLISNQPVDPILTLQELQSVRNKLSKLEVSQPINKTYIDNIVKQFDVMITAYPHVAEDFKNKKLAHTKENLAYSTAAHETTSINFQWSRDLGDQFHASQYISKGKQVSDLWDDLFIYLGDKRIENKEQPSTTDLPELPETL